jgi:hypothetical protein
VCEWLKYIKNIFLCFVLENILKRGSIFRLRNFYKYFKVWRRLSKVEIPEIVDCVYIGYAYNNNAY